MAVPERRVHCYRFRSVRGVRFRTSRRVLALCGSVQLDAISGVRGRGICEFDLPAVLQSHHSRIRQHERRAARAEIVDAGHVVARRNNSRAL